MEWKELVMHYAIEAGIWADALTKTDLLIMLGIFLLGHYMGSKRNGTSHRNDDSV